MEGFESKSGNRYAIFLINHIKIYPIGIFLYRLILIMLDLPTVLIVLWLPQFREMAEIPYYLFRVKIHYLWGDLQVNAKLTEIHL